MPTFDGGHCFLTALLPIKTSEVVDKNGLRSSPVHMVRDALAVLPTAHQSPVTEELPAISPFARCTNTHFARFAVIDDVIFNGRIPTNAILDTSDRTIPQPVDQLPNPYLMMVIDCDAPNGNENDLRNYLSGMWTKMSDSLKPVFAHCFGYDQAATSGNGFADYIIGCQIETTMPFNDYWPPGPLPLKSLSFYTLASVGLGAWIVANVALFALLGTLGLPAPVTAAWTLPFIGEVFATAAAIVAAVAVFRWWPKSLSNISLPYAMFGTWILLCAVLPAAINHLLGTPVALSWLFLFEFASIDAVFLVAAVPAAYALYRLVMARGAKPFPAAPNSDLPSVLKALYLQREVISFAIRMQGKDDATLHSEFGALLEKVRVNDTSHPTQAPGVISP